ncbi:MAG TPA: GNAT family N-acetyltransferase [Fimbriimonadales bacterium]|nr:GNAT family N-acetyltransferase [Fimbriimonadales bacterium]
MKELHFRPYQPSDFEEVANIWSVAFSAGRPYRFGEELEGEESKIYVAEKEKRVLAAFRLHEMRVTRGESDLHCAGVAAVAVAIEARNTGIGKEMLRWSLREMQKANWHISSLYAFRESYYRAFGWACAGKSIRIKCPSQFLSKFQTDLLIRKFPFEKWKELESAYLPFARKYSGMTLRTAKWWRRLLEHPDNPPLIYAIGEPIQAYAVFRLTQDFWVEQQILESAWSTREGYLGLLALFSAIGVNRESVSWHEPSDSPFVAESLDTGVSVSMWSPTMFRVIDLPSAFRALKPDESGEFTFRVFDPELPENEGPWHVRFGSGCVEIERTQSADVEIEGGRLSQAFMGEPSLEDLVRQGMVKVHSENALKHMLRLLHPKPVYSLDRF